MLRPTRSAAATGAFHGQLRQAAIEWLADAVEGNLDPRRIFELLALSSAVPSALRA